MNPDVANRLDRLERTNRYLWWGLFATNAACMFILGVMTFRGRSAVLVTPDAPRQFDKLVTRELEIVDAAGAGVAWLGMVPGRPGKPDRIQLQLGDEKTYMTLSAEPGFAQMDVAAGNANAWLSAQAVGEFGKDCGTAIVKAKNSNGDAALRASIYPGAVISDGQNKIRNVGLGDLREPEFNADQDARLREGRRRSAEIMRLYAKQLRGEISDAEALDRISRLVEEDAKE